MGRIRSLRNLSPFYFSPKVARLPLLESLIFSKESQHRGSVQPDMPRCNSIVRAAAKSSRGSMRAQCTGSTVAADNDAILCIGYSAHIRGRILRVDLSLSSLLGMHVCRPAIMRARESVRERADRRSSLGLCYNTMHVYTSGIREGTLRHTTSDQI